MIELAIKKYGQVYFSNASRLDFNIKYPKQGYDPRYLTDEGNIFGNGLINKNVIPQSWFRFPEI